METTGRGERDASAAAGPRIAIATCEEFPALTPADGPLLKAFEARGLEPVPVVWSSAGVEWEGFHGCLLRSTWDYHLHHREFLAWAQRTAALMPLWNPAELVAWNAQKGYLRELEEAGVPTIPTVWLPRGSEVGLGEVLAERGWEQAVVKPAVDLGALNLSRVGDGAPDGQGALERILAEQDAMVQPFLPSLEARGELSLVYIGGFLSHAVRKRPREGDFRVQERWGGKAELAEPGGRELEVGELALAEVEAAPLYARVDLVEGPAGERWLIELELIEPNLYLRELPSAAGALAEALVAELAV